jgi:hypothetical protein
VRKLVSDIKGGKHRQRVYEKRVLRRIFEAKMIGDWKKTSS